MRTHPAAARPVPCRLRRYVATRRGVTHTTCSPASPPAASITPCIIIGAYAGRMRFFASLLFCALWMFAVYVPFARMVWGGGLLEHLGLIDFAGGVVIHVTAGAASLVAAQVIGPRLQFAAEGGKPPPPGNLIAMMCGSGLFWVCWLAFCGGSTPSPVSPETAWVFLNSMVAASAGGLAWLLSDSFLPGSHRRPTGFGMCLGFIAGLVVITPAALFVSPWGALAMGAIGAATCRFVTEELRRTAVARGSDDAAEAFGLHGTGGIVGKCA